MGPRGALKYTEEQLNAAAEAVLKGMPFKKAAKMHGVPRSTLQFRCSDKFSKVTHGPAPVLSEEEENTLQRCVARNLFIYLFIFLILHFFRFHYKLYKTSIGYLTLFLN